MNSSSLISIPSAIPFRIIFSTNGDAFSGLGSIDWRSEIFEFRAVISDRRNSISFSSAPTLGRFESPFLPVSVFCVEEKKWY